MTIELEPAGKTSMQEGNHMAANQFADLSRDLYTQIKIVETLVKGSLFKEAKKMLSKAEASCENLESLMSEDNKIQMHIISNRRLEIHWIHDAIQQGLAKNKPVVKKRVTKPK